MPKNMMLTNLARYDKGLVANNETFLTEEGFIKGKAIVTRCGVFLYKNADGTIRRELRHPDDVMLSDSLESIKLIPIVDGHPPERLVTSENSQRLSVGYTGEFVEMDSPYVIANLVITDKKIVEKVKDKKKNELSLGYTVDLLPLPGVYNGEPYDYKQTNIRYNHLALVDEARAGPEARIALDGDDAVLITQEEFVMSDAKKDSKKQRKVKIDAEEYLMEDDAAEGVEGLKGEIQRLKDELAYHKEMLEKAHAERDSLRDKDMHDPKAVHEPLENDEIGANGKEEPDPMDSYGMQSHVRDYDKPSHMENHVVKEPKNQHYPHDLPKIPNVDAAEVNKRVNQRVALIRYAERYLDKSTLTRVDGLSDVEIKKKVILSIQKNAVLDGKSDVYINARFDSVVESLPKQKVIANPSRYDAQDKEQACADDSRKAMIRRQKEAYKVGRK